MKKKIFSLLTALIMVAGLLCVTPVVSAGAEDYEDYEYYALADGTIEIFAYYGDAEELEIPAYIDDMPVTSIGDYAFAWCENLTVITIPDSITSIGEGAFYDCESLTGITIPGSVISIGEGAFAVCESLTDIIIPDSVTSIGAYAFYDTPWLESKYVENPLVIINNILVDGTTAEGDVVIPDGVEIIGDCAFECTSLTSVTIPDSVIYIGCYAFSECDDLTSVTIPSNVEYIDFCAFGYTFDYDEWEFITLEDFKIYCYSGTAGEEYAIDNEFDYELIGGLALTLEEIDINGDGKITTADVGLVNAHAKGIKLLSGEYLEKADANRDGKITTADVGIINSYAKGIKELA